MMASVGFGLAAFVYVAFILVLCRALSINQLWMDK